MSKLTCGLIQMGLKGEVSMGSARIRDRMLGIHICYEEPWAEKMGEFYGSSANCDLSA